MLGEWMALLSAVLWATAVLAFEQAGKRFSPRQLNLLKGVLALGAFGLTLGVLQRWPWLELSGSQTGWLALSGLVGITLGDTAYFAALQRLGTRRTLLLGILSPIIAALLGWIALHETLSLQAWAGLVLTLAGVAWVISQRKTSESPRQMWIGVGYGLLAVAGQALGALVTRSQFNHADLDPIVTAFVRLSAGTLGVLVWWSLARPERNADAPGLKLRQDPALYLAALGTFLGTYIAMMTYMVALKYAAIGIVQTLLATSQIWGLVLDALRGEKLAPSAWLGTGLALGGIVLIFYT